MVNHNPSEREYNTSEREVNASKREVNASKREVNASEREIRASNIEIDANTHVLFTMKKLLGLLGSMLVLFFGFYMLIIVPRTNQIEQHYENMYIDQKEQNRLFYQELGNINKSIESLNLELVKSHPLLKKYVEIQNNNTKNTNTSLNIGSTDNKLNKSNVNKYLNDNTIYQLLVFKN